MATFQINTRDQIKSDGRQWTIRRLYTVKGEEAWKVLGYYTSLEAAADELLQRLVRESDAEGGAEVLAEVKRIATQLSHALTPLYSVEIKPTGDTA